MYLHCYIRTFMQVMGQIRDRFMSTGTWHALWANKSSYTNSIFPISAEQSASVIVCFCCSVKCMYRCIAWHSIGFMKGKFPAVIILLILSHTFQLDIASLSYANNSIVWSHSQMDYLFFAQYNRHRFDTTFVTRDIRRCWTRPIMVLQGHKAYKYWWYS